MKVLVIEDEDSLRGTIVRSLEKERFIAEWAADYRTAMEKLNDYDYDCVLLDIMLPDGNGLALLEELKKMRKKESVIIISAKDSIEDKVTGLDLGADDYLVKPFSFAELNARIKALLRRPGTETAVVAPLLACGDLELNYASRRARRGTEEVDLTEKEFRLLEFLMQNQGAALSRQVLLKNVWERDFETNTNVVDVYVNYLRGKVDRDPARRLIHTVVGIGYMMQAK